MKNLFKKILIIMCSLLLSLFISSSTALAQNPTPEPAFDNPGLLMFAKTNPLFFLRGDPELTNLNYSFSVSGFINKTLSFLFPIAGTILFVMIVWGGFEMMTGAASKKNLDAGKQRVTAAIIGFLLLFVSYWIIQIIEYVTKVKILG